MPLINYIGNRQECSGDNAGAGRVQRGPAPPPPSLSVDYLIVGGGSAGRNPGIGGSAGGVRSGSAAIGWNSILTISVGAGGTSSGGTPVNNAASSSISGSSFGLVGAGGASGGSSGAPSIFSEGVSGPGGITQGGGAGSSKDGNNGATGQNGDGGTGSVWLNGIYYGGGGGGASTGNPGYPGLGGGGTAQVGIGPDNLPYQLNGYDGRGGGAAGTGTAGGSGSVIIRYPNTVPRMGDGGYEFQSGGFYYHEFTSSGQFTYQFQ